MIGIACLKNGLAPSPSNRDFIQPVVDFSLTRWPGLAARDRRAINASTD
jgi:hypothetical protein